jgi:hypothetical protein
MSDATTTHRDLWESDVYSWFAVRTAGRSPVAVRSFVPVQIGLSADAQSAEPWYDDRGRLRHLSLAAQMPCAVREEDVPCAEVVLVVLLS